MPSDAELVRYLTGESTPLEARAIEQWLDVAPEHRQRLDELRLVLGATAPERPAWDAEASWRRLAGRLEPARRPEIVRAPPRFGPSPVRRWLVAAGIGAVLAAGWYAERELRGAGETAPAAVAAMTERRTGPGERAAFRLADGTSVMLGPASRLRYSAAEYGAGTRTVELEGDGYFEVVHDERRPFVIRTSTALIRDLGTRFVVRARPDEERVEVGVSEGRVAIGPAAAPADSVVLDPGDAARLEGTEQLRVSRGVNLDRYFAWTEGRLVFERAPLPAVVEELERWYDIEIELAGRGIESRLLTAAFRDKPAPDVLALVAASLDLAVSGSGQRFVLSTR